MNWVGELDKFLATTQQSVELLSFIQCIVAEC